MMISEIQSALNRLGAQPSLIVDGFGGKLTRAAITTFQTKYGLKADGIAGPITMAAIQKKLGGSTPPTGKIVYCRIGYGLGGSLTSGGIDQLWQQIKAKYPSVILPSPFSGGQQSQVAQDILSQPVNTPIVIGGYSWDADNVSLIANAVYGQRRIAYLFAWQPSVYYPTVPLGDNVDEAECVYNPNFIATGGLGFRQLSLASGNKKTKFTLIETTDSHPTVQYDTRYHELALAGIGRIVARST